MVAPALPTSIVSPHSMSANAGELKAPLDRAVKEFESLFVSMLLKEMRQTLGEDGLFPGDSSDSLGGMFDQQMAEHICQQGGLGLAETFRSDITAVSAAYRRNAAPV
ncbi:MAG: rod-binding protein [Planctomycetaceae bacterium]